MTATKITSGWSGADRGHRWPFLEGQRVDLTLLEVKLDDNPVIRKHTIERKVSGVTVWMCSKKCFYHTDQLADIVDHLKDFHNILSDDLPVVVAKDRESTSLATNGSLSSEGSPVSESFDYKLWSKQKEKVKDYRKRYVCRHLGCGKSFQGKSSLVSHQKYHLCGFSLRPLEDTDQCSNKQLSRHWKEYLDNSGRTRYVCLLCDYKGGQYDLRRHVHNKHVCYHWISNNFKDNSSVFGVHMDTGIGKVTDKDTAIDMDTNNGNTDTDSAIGNSIDTDTIIGNDSDTDTAIEDSDNDSTNEDMDLMPKLMPMTTTITQIMVENDTEVNDQLMDMKILDKE